MIPVMIELLTDTRHHKYRGVSSQPVQFPKSLNSFRFGYDDECHALAESSARIVLSKFDYSAKLLLWNSHWSERTEHSPLSNNPFEFHATVPEWVWLKRVLSRYAPATAPLTL